MVMEEQGKIGPHEGLEFDLMLAGKKDIAYFGCDLDHPGVDPRFSSLKDGDEIVRLDRESEFKMPMHIFYRRGQQKKALCFYHMLHASLYNAPVSKSNCWQEMEIIIGSLLGYSRADVDAFIKHWQQLK